MINHYFFDLVNDKMELFNLANQKSEKLKELEELLDNYLIDVSAPSGKKELLGKILL